MNFSFRGKIPTTPVTFSIVNKSTGEVDENFEPIIEERKFTMNCVIHPTGVEELGEGFKFHNRILVTVHIPKTFTEDLRGAGVTINGVDFQIISVTFPFTKTPSAYNRQIICEAVQ